MLAPLVLLAIGAVFAGYGFAFKWFLPEGGDIAHPHHGKAIFLTILILLALAGIALGYLLYRNRNEEPYRVPLLANKFYLDEIYLGIVRVFQDTIAYVAKAIDQLLIDGLLVRGTARLTSGVGSMLRGLQVGNLQGYAFLFGIGVILVLYIITTSLK
jgi:NADH-quinone oxidoreductase subunit L